MTILEAIQSYEVRSSGRDLHFIFGYFGLAMCMSGAIYAAALPPGNTVSDLALMSVFP